MSRLPVPGSDTNTWGNILNEFLGVEHESDGTLKASGSLGQKLSKASNLSDLTSTATARSNLGLGNAATKSVGTTSGTVAAGDDSRITNAVQKGDLVINVRDYGAAGDDSTDDLSAIQAALTAAGTNGATVMLKGAHVINGRLDIPSNVTLDGAQGSLRQTASLTTALRVNNATKVTIRNVKITGLGSDYVNNSSVYSAGGIWLTGTTSNTTIEDCTIQNCAGSGVYTANTVSNFTIRGTTIIGPGAPPIVGTTSNYGGGVAISDGCNDWSITNCNISQFAQGIVTGEINRFVIADNVIHDIVGQHGMYLEPGNKFTITGNVVNTTVLQGMKLQIPFISSPDADLGVITGNIFVNTGSHCILLTNVPGGSLRLRRIVVANNTLSGDGSGSGEGISSNNLAGVQINGNNIYNVRKGIAVSTATGTRIFDNYIESCADQGISLTDVSDCRISRNEIKNPGSANNAATEFGISASGTSSDAVVVDNNRVYDANSNMRYGIFLSLTGGQSYWSVRNNEVVGATDYGSRLDSAQAIKEWTDNNVNGTLGDITGFPTTLYIRRATFAGPRANALIGAAFDPTFANTNGGALTTGQLYVIRVDLSDNGPLIAVRYFLGGAGTGLTAGQCLIGIYDATGALIGQTGDQSTNMGGTGEKDATLTTAVQGMTVGKFVYVAFLANGSTGPNLRAFAASASFCNTNVSSLPRWSTAGSGLTALPSTLPSLSAATVPYWCGIR